MADSAPQLSQQAVAPGSEKALSPVALSESQKLAISASIDRPLLILAAAGSGKTLVLCHRILHLISQGVHPKTILAVTFTRRAGEDLRCRLQSVASSCKDGKLACVEGVRVGTFHSFCLSVLRTFSAHAGLGPDFIIFTPKMQLELLQELVQGWIEGKRPRNDQHDKSVKPEQRALFKLEAQRILARVRKLGSCRDTSHVADEGGTGGDSVFNGIYHKYCQALKDINGVDFDSFTRHTIQVFQRHPEALQAPEVCVHHVLVDEFQDTDTGQFELLKLLCGQHKRITLVGDDDQQIYSWRGAAGYHNLQSFEEVFAGGSICKMEQNFRSSGAIVAAARHLIAKNRNRMPKSIRTSSPTGTLLKICECRNERCEAAAVADHILALHEQGVPLREMVVLYRLHRVGLGLQHQLQARQIPCGMKGSALSMVDGKVGVGNPTSTIGTDSTGAVFDHVLAVLRLVVSESDDLACNRLSNLLCPNPDPAISACLFFLTNTSGMPTIQALRCIRSHLLGVLLCKELSLFQPAQSMHRLTASQEQVLNGWHTLLKLVATAKEQLQCLNLREAVRNVVQQVSAFKDAVNDCGNLGSQEHSSSRKRLNPCSLSKSRESPDQGCGSFEFAGIRALLKEADCFEEQYSYTQNSTLIRNQTASRRFGKKGERKASKLVTLGMFDANSKSPIQPSDVAINKLKAFLDNVAVRMFEHELGDVNNVKKSSTNEASEGSPGRTSAPADIVTLATIHQAKGLEWSSVIIVRANEGVMPLLDVTCPIEENHVVEGDLQCPLQAPIVNGVDASQRTNSAPQVRGSESEDPKARPTSIRLSRKEQELEEERRLFYVALTRAKKSILVTHVSMDGGQQQIASRFLSEIPRGLTQRVSRYDSHTANASGLPQCQPPEALVSPVNLAGTHLSSSHPEKLNTCKEKKPHSKVKVMK